MENAVFAAKVIRFVLSIHVSLVTPLHHTIGITAAVTTRSASTWYSTEVLDDDDDDGEGLLYRKERTALL